MSLFEERLREAEEREGDGGMSLSEERLREVEERVAGAKRLRDKFGWPLLLSERDARDMLAEVIRLRTGIEAIAYALGPGLPAADLGVVWAATDTARQMARDLLNPTEKDTVTNSYESKPGEVK